jgi:hypothetical protein
MDPADLMEWLNALAELQLIDWWHWDLEFGLAGLFYLINDRCYTLEGAVKLVRDFEAAGPLRVTNPM